MDDSERKGFDSPHDQGVRIRQLQGRLLTALTSHLGTNYTFTLGFADLVFAASTNSNPRTVTHGLPSAPVWCGAFGTADAGVYDPFYVGVEKTSIGATSFDVVGRHPTAITRSDLTFFWIAIAESS